MLMEGQQNFNSELIPESPNYRLCVNPVNECVLATLLKVKWEMTKFWAALSNRLSTWNSGSVGATVRLLIRARWPRQRTGYRPGYDPGPVLEVRSSEFRRVCYRINILGSQLSPSSIILVLAQAGKVNVGLASHRHRGLPAPTGSTAKDREMSTDAYVPSGVAPFTLLARGGGILWRPPAQLIIY